MANKRGLGTSRKFADGTQHENGTGKFEIINRYEGEDGKAWLEFQWLTGDRAGQIDRNSEANVNSAIHKFQITRRAAGKEVDATWETSGPGSGGSVVDMIESVSIIVQQNNDLLVQNTDVLTKLSAFIMAYNDRQDGLKGIIEKQMTIMDGFRSEIDKMVAGSKLMAKQQDAMNKQQDTVNKLIDMNKQIIAGVNQ